MKKRTLSLLLGIVLMFSLAVPVAMAEGDVCPECGTSDGHAVDCITRCICDEAGGQPDENTHVATCPLYQCIYCGAYLNQGEEHLKSCHGFCDCGYPENTHTPECKIYKCGYCSVYPNQGEAHDRYNCPEFACYECGALFHQVGPTPGCLCYYHLLVESMDGEDAVVDYDVYSIAFVDKSQATITLFNDNVGTFGTDYSYETLNTADCPDVLLVRDQFRVGSELKYYGITSFDIDFYDNHAGYYNYAEPGCFSSVVPAAGLYATFAAMDGGDTILLYNEDGDFVEVDAALLAGEYVVDAFSGFEWKFKLIPGANWPADAAYCLVDADNLRNLSQTPTQPEEPTEPQEPTHSEGCGDECIVEGCACACHNALLQRFYTATNLEELDDMVLAATEEEWSTFPEEAWPWLEQLYASLPTSYKIFGATEYDPPVESEVWYPTVNFTNAAAFRTPVTGQ